MATVMLHPQPVKTTDKIVYSSPMSDGTFYVLLRDARTGKNPRSMVLTGSQVLALEQRAAQLERPSVSKVAAAFLLLAGVSASTIASVL